MFSCFYSSSSLLLLLFFFLPFCLLLFPLVFCLFTSCSAPLPLVLPLYLLSYSFASCPAPLPLVLLLCLLSCSFTSYPAPLILILHSSSVVFKSEHNIFLFKKQMGGGHSPFLYTPLCQCSSTFSFILFLLYSSFTLSFVFIYP